MGTIVLMVILQGLSRNTSTISVGSPFRTEETIIHVDLRQTVFEILLSMIRCFAGSTNTMLTPTSEKQMSKVVLIHLFLLRQLGIVQFHGSTYPRFIISFYITQ